MSGFYERSSAKIRSLPLLIALLLLGIFTATRVGLTAFTGLDSVPSSLWPGIFAKGLWFDLAVIAVVIAPACLYEALLPDRRRASRWHRRLRSAALWGAVSLALFCAAAEATFWLEFSTRLNFIAVDYLLYTHEVIGNIRESYPVGWIFSAIGGTAAGIVWCVGPLVREIDSRSVPRAGRIGLTAAALLLPALSLGLADVDQMRGLGNAYADELSGNGLFTFFAAMRRNELDYDKFYRTIPQAEADATLSELQVARAPWSAALRQGTGRAAPDRSFPFKKRPRSVVIICIESLSTSFVGAYGSIQGLTPNLDRLARQGLRFERAFATGTRTVRGLEALSLGTPPVPGQAIVRRPRNEGLATVGGLLARQGFSAFFIYGGFGYFDNMNAYFARNEHRVLDRRDFPGASVVFSNIWGVADESLFDNALTALDREARQRRPFFALIMTTSNHRPYTYPDGRIDIPSPGGREGAVKYTDYAIGKFINDAKAKPWFDDTLFVIVADHCASVAGKAKLPVENYRIPMIFYAPALLKPGSYESMVSQVDLPPTLIKVLGKRGAGHFFGRSIFQAGRNPERAFIANYQELGYLRRGVLTVLLPKRRVESYRIDPKTYAAAATRVDPQLLSEAIAYYQTASRAAKEGALRAPYKERMHE